MTTEDDFHRYLDENPEDWQTRLVFADWLQERGDPRAEGYRALGVQRRVPCPTGGGSPCPWFANTGARHDGGLSCDLPTDWFDLIVMFGKSSHYVPDHDLREDATRHEIEDAAALAFSLLPQERRQELTNVKVAVHTL